jgi:tetratricopeptide (TPR) repeat protein
MIDMSSTDRITALQRMLERNPSDARVHFGLAMEYEKLGRWQDVVSVLRTYLDTAVDEGNAWGRLGNALEQLGLHSEAADAYDRGIAAARAHGHPSMAAEFEHIRTTLRSVGSDPSNHG